MHGSTASNALSVCLLVANIEYLTNITGKKSFCVFTAKIFFLQLHCFDI